MKARFFLPLFLLLLPLAAFAGGAKMNYNPNTEYSADMVMTANGQTTTGKVYHSAVKQRHEMHGMTTIMRMDKKVSWMLMPEQKTYMESKLEGPQENVVTAGENNDAEVTEMGSDTVNGFVCTKYKVVPKKRRQDESLVWISKEGIMMKLEATDANGHKMVTEMKNVKLGKVDPALFELPKGYKPGMPDMSQLMKGMMHKGKH